jgi:hypothetical protein
LDNETILNGWKEIADYLHCGVRTVQRWEETGLPIRRENTKGGRKGVIALRGEIDAWLRRVPLHERMPSERQESMPSEPKSIAPLISHSRQLQQEVAASAGDLLFAIQELKETVELLCSPTNASQSATSECIEEVPRQDTHSLSRIA